MAYPSTHIPTASDGTESLLAELASALQIQAVAGEGQEAILAKIAAAAVSVSASITAPTGVRRYVALLNQSGSSAPVATVLENTLGGTVTWGRTSLGVYSGTLVNTFTANKTTVFAGKTDPEGIVTSGRRSSATAVIVTTFDTVAQDFSDNALVNTAVEIRVYP